MYGAMMVCPANKQIKSLHSRTRNALQAAAEDVALGLAIELTVCPSKPLKPPSTAPPPRASVISVTTDYSGRVASAVRFVACCSYLDALAQLFADQNLPSSHTPPSSLPCPLSRVAEAVHTPVDTPPANSTPCSTNESPVSSTAALAAASTGATRLLRVMFKHLPTPEQLELASLQAALHGTVSEETPLTKVGLSGELHDVWTTTTDEVQQILGVRCHAAHSLGLHITYCAHQA
jgi:hypothetical protein